VGSDFLLASRSGPLGRYLVGCFQTTLLYGRICSVRSAVTAMITEAPFSDGLRAALAYVNNRLERTSRWPERWMIHRPDGSFALCLVNWEVRSDADFQPPIARLPELTEPRVMTALTRALKELMDSSQKGLSENKLFVQEKTK
jgi:hypothetical protein